MAGLKAVRRQQVGGRLAGVAGGGSEAMAAPPWW